MKTEYQLNQLASPAQGVRAAQAEAERRVGNGPLVARRPALDGRFWAAAGAALAVASACAITLLWPWDEPPPAGVGGQPAAAAGAPRSVAVAAAPSAASMVSPPDASRLVAAPGAAIASPFGSAGMTPDAAHEGAYAAQASAAETPAPAERGNCGNGCPQAAAAQAGPPFAAPVALLAAALPKDLDAWSLDPQPLAPPSAAPQPAPRLLGNTPQIPDEADATPGEDSPAEGEPTGDAGA